MLVNLLPIHNCKMTKTSIMDTFKGFLLALLLGCLFLLNSCDNSTDANSKKAIVDFEDGIYLIERTGNTTEKVLPLAENERKIEFNEEFIEKTDQDVKYIVINKDEYAPLKLKTAPKTEAQDDNRKKLMLELTEQAKEQLKDFTTKHLNQLTTIVVNGEALTMHKIKSIIDGGFLQITRCTDNACEMLYVELQDNVVKE